MLKFTYPAIKTGKTWGILYVAMLYIVISRDLKTKVLIRMRGIADFSAFKLLACNTIRLRGYKTCVMLKSADHEIYPSH